MKRILFFFAAPCIALLLFAGCQKSISITEETVANNSTVPYATGCNPYAYVITLESKTKVGTQWEWVWSVRNPNPGSGNNGTSQALGHWAMQFGTCFNWSSVVAAATSPDGSDWTSFTPTYQVDASQSCVATPALIYNLGTIDGVKSYYRLTLNQDYMIGSVFGFYKSGAKTGCCTFNFSGPGCEVDDTPTVK